MTNLDRLDAGSLAPLLEPGAATPYDGPAAAVAAVLRHSDQGPELLFIERAAKQGDPWSGQVAFPGGRTDPGDVDSRATAYRETREEVGLDLSPAQDLGRLSDLEGGPRGSRQRLRVSPHVCWWSGPRPPLALNYEVADALWVPIAQLADPAHRVDYAYPPLGDQLWPGIKLDERRVLWGLTLRMTEDFFRRIGQPLEIPRDD